MTRIRNEDDRHETNTCNTIRQRAGRTRRTRKSVKVTSYRPLGRKDVLRDPPLPRPCRFFFLFDCCGAFRSSQVFRLRKTCAQTPNTYRPSGPVEDVRKPHSAVAPQRAHNGNSRPLRFQHPNRALQHFTYGGLKMLGQFYRIMTQSREPWSLAILVDPGEARESSRRNGRLRPGASPIAWKARRMV